MTINQETRDNKIWVLLCLTRSFALLSPLPPPVSHLVSERSSYLGCNGYDGWFAEFGGPSPEYFLGSEKCRIPNKSINTVGSYKIGKHTFSKNEAWGSRLKIGVVGQ
jgi:hypothetical protein